MIEVAGALNLNNFDIIEIESTLDPSIEGIDSQFAVMAIQYANNETIIWKKTGPSNTDWSPVGSGQAGNPYVGLPLLSASQILSILNPTDRQIALHELGGVIVPQMYDSVSQSWHNWLGERLIVQNEGEGPSGTYHESFETDFGNFSQEGTGVWTRTNGNTPSNNTGNINPQEGSYDAYTEVSSGHDADTFILETNYFKKLQSINFYYNLYGSNIGTFSIQYKLSDGNWYDFWSTSSETAIAWININLDMSQTDAIAIRFDYRNASGWEGDCLIDNINIVSN